MKMNIKLERKKNETHPTDSLRTLRTLELVLFILSNKQWGDKEQQEHRCKVHI